MNRIGVRPATRDLAEQLVALEAAAVEVVGEDSLATCRVCEKLRRPLINLAGPAGYCSLLSRALTLATRDAPELANVRVTQAGTLQGLTGEAAEVSTTLIAHLIELLATLIGESLCLRFLHDIWPELRASAANTGERSRNEQIQ